MVLVKIPPPGRMVDIGGRRLHVQTAGAGHPVVILESGIAASSLNWTLVQRLVANSTTVVSYDRAGFGWSDAPAHGCSAADAARDLGVLLDRLELAGPFVLAGHSFGGLIVRVFQQQHPDLFAGMVLVDPIVRTEWRDLTPPRARMLERGVRLSRRGAVLARMGIVRLALNALMSGSRTIPNLIARASAGQGTSVIERLTGEVRKIPKDLWPAIADHWSEARCFRGMADALENLPLSVTQIDEERSLGDLPLIVLSAASASPQALIEHQHEARLSARGEHRLVPNTGHWIQLDDPHAVAAAIQRICGDQPHYSGRDTRA
jgi:pimeloyl-ACP methyl ester carboxylesterase